ncbi:MBL fold metallo-hydrolase [Cellulophaga sp. BC115SP]|uniref:MBL fold metallo-hydrolase n=1 Tax=Cellulophaga sp. BC115SP TaxID=2683263 RepID=UPI0014133DD7|nr:3',5'-cyclic-nucleotide phosphodiesterase [Cellulophaga sp. BC115SP]NBB27182.1 3',5'-cyclic-nucleotide phosphodiesterase [Cellulophaga sp. BC115SP]
MIRFNKQKIFTLATLSLLSLATLGQKAQFDLIPLGVKGGTDESNMSCYMLGASGSEQFVALDAGTVYAGLQKAVEKKTFTLSASQVMRKYIKGYFISHPHLDHASGLIINSPGDTAKSIYATQKCMTIMQENYFNDKTWVNFGDAGVGVLLKKYHYATLPLETEEKIAGTDMTVKAFSLSHIEPFESTAFLIKHQDSYVLYLGDTGPDELEKAGKLKNLWKNIAPLIKNKQLKGILIEVSFPNEQPNHLLFGHLTPQWLMKEMSVLADLAGKENMKGLNVVITHLKPPAINEQKIIEQVKAQNILGLNIIFPQQGEKIKL